MHSFKNSLRVLSLQLKNATSLTKRAVCSSSTTQEIRQHRNELFTAEQKKQRDKVGRIEKIEVRYLGLPEDTTFIMNKGISTPYNCAQHLTDIHCKRSVVALVDGKLPWDIHRPLPDTCTLQLLRFTDADPHIANKTFWRSCSFLLGAILTDAFKEHISINLHSFPSPMLKPGSFVHDFSLTHDDWKPNGQELRTLSAELVKLAAKDIKFERLEVSHDLAFEIFKDNPYKREQLPSISRNGSVILYRVGEHIDISRGPMMSSTSHVGRCSITAVHKLSKEADGSTFYRAQGVALPSDIIINHFAYSILEKRSEKLNPAHLPNEPFEDNFPPRKAYEEN